MTYSGIFNEYNFFLCNKIDKSNYKSFSTALLVLINGYRNISENIYCSVFS